jgi:MFS family permease
LGSRLVVEPSELLSMGYNELWQQTALVFVSSLLFVAIVLCALATDWAKSASDERQELGWWMSTDVGTTLLIVRVLQGVLTAASSAAVSSSFMQLHWSKMHRKKGLRLIDLLALSPTTPLSGTIRIILSRHSKQTARVWAIVR